MIGDKPLFHKLDEIEGVDIDTMLDFEFAEFLHKNILNKYEKKTKVLVTGGAGFIGAHLVQKLVEENYKVMAVDSMETIGGIPFKNPKSKFIVGNILDKSILGKIKKWKNLKLYFILQLNQERKCIR